MSRGVWRGALVRSLVTAAMLPVAVANADEKPASPQPRSLRCDLAAGRHEGLSPDDLQRLRLTRLNDGFGRKGVFVSQPMDLGKAGNFEVRWIEQWTTPQRWKKHQGNPIYGPRQSGAWDTWTNGVSIVRNPDGKSYKMYYSGRSGAGIGFAEASIDSPLAWQENPASPVLRPRTDNWEGYLINQPRVVRVTDQHWRMYYTGWGLRGRGGSNWAFGLAESFDAGRTWKRYGDKPLLRRGPPGAPDDGGVFVPEVRKIGDGWMMWYTAMKMNPGKQSIHLCLATSDDGVNWSKYENNPVLSDDFTVGPSRNVTSRCFARYEGGVFHLWYSHARPDYRIRYAESLDGIIWERSPIPLALDVTPGKAWDSEMVEYPEIDVVDGEWRMWFCGNGFGSVGFAEGEAETGLSLTIRSGGTSQPDAAWTGWTPVVRSAAVPCGRFVQVRADFRSDNPRLSPALVEIECMERAP